MTNMMQPSILVMAGGTGGHVFPALAVARKLQERGVHVEWLGTQRGIESRIVPEAGIKLHCIKVAGLRGKSLLGMIKGLFALGGAMFEAASVIRKLKPACVLGMGGFASGPGGIVSRIVGKPLVIHEQNAVAGTTNRLLAKISSKVLLGYPIQLGGTKSIYLGNPIRREIASIASPDQRHVGAHGKLKLLVLGGSLGAKPINDILPRAIKLLSATNQVEIWHQTGERHAEAVVTDYRQSQVEAKVDAFISDMAAAYSWADIVVCRSGALTVAEIAAVGVASVLIPLPHAIDDHQTENARWLADAGAAFLVPQSEFSEQGLADILVTLQQDKNQLLTMAISARNLAKMDAADRVADVCMELANDE